MPNGFPAFRQSYSGFPNDHPPTLFHPASPKIKPAKPSKEVDTMSTITVSSFASTNSLLKLKENVKSKLSKKKEAQPKKQLPRDSRSAKEQTVNGYMVTSVLK